MQHRCDVSSADDFRGGTRGHVDIEPELSELLSEFARTLLTDFPGQAVLDHLVIRIVEVLPIDAAGVTLRTGGSDAIYVAASSHEALRLEQLQSELGEGPSRLVFDSGAALSIPHLSAEDRMPNFGRRAACSGFGAVFSFPLCGGDTTLGTLDLYAVEPGPMQSRHLEIAQTLADVAAAYAINASARGDLLDAAAAARRSRVAEKAGARALRASVRSNRRAGAALDASEARNTAILASALDAVVTVDEQGRIVDFNASAERLFGYAQSDLVGRRIVDVIVRPEEREGHRECWEGLLENDDTTLGGRTEFTAVKANGSEFPAEVSTHVVDGQGPSFVTGFVRDLTAERAASAERADLEAQLHQVQRLESLGRLAGGVAHDFNNLLTVILGYASSIEETSSDDLEVRDDARQILAAGARAARLTRQLLTFARRQPVKYGPVDLNAAVSELRAMLTKTVGENVRLNVQLEDDLPPIYGDQGQTDQVLLNLAANARDAMTGGGILTICTAMVTLNENDARVRQGLAAGEYVQLSVEDSGEGMEPDVASHAFDPFFTTRPPGQNSGLGLATVHGIVNDVGGTIQLDTEVGGGTTVTALFPVDRSNPSPVDGQGEPPRGNNGETILVVEDEQGVLKVTAKMLRRQGYVALEASSAADAVDVFDHENVDLLLTDVIMPVSSGRELAEALQAKDDNLRVLFMSGSLGDASGRQARLAPGLALLQKPFEAVTLAAAVGAALHDPGAGAVAAGETAL